MVVKGYILKVCMLNHDMRGLIHILTNERSADRILTTFFSNTMTKLPTGVRILYEFVGLFSITRDMIIDLTNMGAWF